MDADEMEAAIAGLDLTEEDEADLRRQLDELDVEVVTVRASEPDVVEAPPRWYHTLGDHERPRSVPRRDRPHAASDQVRGAAAGPAHRAG